MRPALLGHFGPKGGHLEVSRSNGPDMEKLTMMGGSGIAMGFVGLLAMGVFLLVLVGLVVWLVARPRNRS